MFEETKDKFLNFVCQYYDINEAKVKHKLNHTFHVVKNAEYLCQKLHLDNENTYLAMLIALLHDIGRFEEAIKLKSFREDRNAFNHAVAGVKLLFEDNLIRTFIIDDKDDEIIKSAILNHNKYDVTFTNLNADQILHCKIIRDADKMDSFRAKYEEDIYTMANITQNEIETSLLSKDIFEDFMMEKTIVSKKRKTPVDIWVSYIAFIYGFYFKESLMYLQKYDYVNKLIDRFTYKCPKTKEKMALIRIKSNNYIQSRLKEEGPSF